MVRFGKKVTTRARLVSVLGAVLVLLVLPAPAMGAEGGTVDATVSVEAPCLMVSTTSVDFGTRRLSTPSQPVFGAARLALTNCSSGSEMFLAKGTEATNPGATITWALDDAPNAACDKPANTYNLTNQGLPDANPNLRLSMTNKTLYSAVSATETKDIDALLEMPCSNSDGLGQSFSLRMIYTATF